MANFQALTIQLGSSKRVQPDQGLVVGLGVYAGGDNNLVLSPGGAGTDVQVAANKNLSAAAGAGNVDLGDMTGTFDTPAGQATLNGDVSVAAGKDIVAAAGAGDLDWSLSTGATKTGSGAVSINGTATVAADKNLLCAAGTSQLDFSLGTGIFKTPTGEGTYGCAHNTFTNAIYANGGVDRSAAAKLSIGTVNANAIDIGANGILTHVLGDLTVAGIETVVGTTEFDDDALFKGDVIFGDTAADTVEFVATIGPAAGPDFIFVKELAHVLKVQASTTAVTAGGALSIASGNGNGAAGGALGIDTGTGTVGGALSIGTANAATVGIGVTARQTSLYGKVALGTSATDYITMTGEVDTDLVFKAQGSVRYIYPAQSTVAGTVGDDLEIDSGEGAAATAGVPGAVGGDAFYMSGSGGAGSAAQVAGRSGDVYLNPRASGADGGAGGAIGADVYLRGGNGTGAEIGGSAIIDAGWGTGAGADGAVTIGAGHTASIGLGQAGVTTTVTGGLTQLTGAVSLTGNAASQISTVTAGGNSLTITAGAASTWGTAAGALTISGKAGLNLQYDGSTMLAVGNNALTVQAGVTLGTTSTGNIDLPQNANARFKIEGVNTTANVTAANLNELTGGGATTLHSHSGIGAVTVTVTAGEALNAGAPVTMANSGGNPRAYEGDANGAGNRVNVAGFAPAAGIANGAPGNIQVTGELAIPDARWDAVPAVGDVGARVYLSETVGKVTLTPPTTTASTVLPVGIVTLGGAGVVKIAINIGNGIIL